jgi:hypothetical protein
VAPEKLYWAPHLPIQYTEIDGNRIRYIKTGSGPTLVLLHTLRTQLDIFEKIVPTLAKSFTVYAPDYPGHGFSDIPKADYAPELFVKAVEGFLDELDLRDEIDDELSAIAECSVQRLPDDGELAVGQGHGLPDEILERLSERRIRDVALGVLEFPPKERRSLPRGLTLDLTHER